MDPFEPIQGVDLAKYAELCAAMMNTGDDVAAQVAIAADQGVSAEAWKAAQAGWTARFSDASNQGKVAHAFYPLYQAAQSRNRGGGEPMPLAQYARIVAEYSFEKDAAGQQVDVNLVLARYGMTTTTWGEVTGYWTPKVNDPADPSAGEFRALVQAESDRILGIVRDAKPAAASPAAAPAPKPAAAMSAAPAATAPPPDVAPPPADKGPTGILDQIAAFINGLLK
jgi:hypothetical protein